MKSKSTIEAERKRQELLLTALEDAHRKLNQIDMLGGEGVVLRGNINKIKGTLLALIWVLEDDVLSNSCI